VSLHSLWITRSSRIKTHNVITDNCKKIRPVYQLTTVQTSHVARCVTFAVARIRVGNRRNFAYFSPLAPKVWETGDPKRLTQVRGQDLPTKFGCDRSIVVGCRSQNDRQTNKQTEWNDNKAHSLRCERDAIKAVLEMTTSRLHTSYKTWTPLMHNCSNDGVILLGPLSSDAMFEVVEISDTCFVRLLLQDAPHTVVNTQLDLNLANLEVTVAAKWTVAFLVPGTPR